MNYGKYSSSSNSISGFHIAGIVVIVLLLFVSCAHSVDKAYNRYEITATVTDKAVKNSSDDSKYLIYAEDVNGEVVVMEITDSILAGRWDSSNVYAAIKVGKTYTFTVGGTREEFMSWYPNIYEYKEIT